MSGIIDCSSPGFVPASMRCEVVIIGSGCGGSTAARVLAERGKDVILLEEGGDFIGPMLTQRDLAMYDQLYVDRASRTTSDRTITILAGRALGGGSIINACDVVPIANEMWGFWQRKFAWTFTPEQMQPFAQMALQDLAATRVEESQLNRNNQILREGAQKLGWRGEVMLHNRKNCQGLGTCLIGCPASAKVNPRMVAIPKALDAGARVLVRVRAVRIADANAEKKRVTVQTLDAKGYHPRETFTIEAQTVIVAANPLGTSRLLQLSGIGNDRVGQQVSLQPQVPCVALMPERVNAFVGIPQAYALTEFERLDPQQGLAGFRIEPIFGTPGILGSLVTQPGVQGKELMAQIDHVAASLVLVPDESVGEIVTHGQQTEVHYTLTAEWKKRARQAVKSAARAYLAAGAKKVLVPAAPLLEVHSEQELHKIDAISFDPATILLISAHQQGGAVLGPNPQTSAADLHGQLWGTRGIYVMDGSIFPSSSSTHTMTPILTMAHKLAAELG